MGRCLVCRGMPHRVGFEVDHVGRHVIGPFEHLGPNAEQEGIRRPRIIVLDSE